MKLSLKLAFSSVLVGGILGFATRDLFENQHIREGFARDGKAVESTVYDSTGVARQDTLFILPSSSKAFKEVILPQIRKGDIAVKPLEAYPNPL